MAAALATLEADVLLSGSECRVEPEGFVCFLGLCLAQATLNLTLLSHSQCLKTLKLFLVFIIHMG